ncbi:MAG: class I SAM-dependent methyltransferase [Desulfobacterales bacterium]|jgi:SAM-dependent methyltransferase
MSTAAADQIGAILSEGAMLRLVAPGLYSVYPEDADAALSYDTFFGTLYDKVACNRLYNRLVWGYSVDEYPGLCREALAAGAGGWMLDAGCGSLAFTAAVYAAGLNRPVVCLDRSLRLLKIARNRLLRKAGRVPENLVLLHADALVLPFKPAVFDTIFCLNLLHVLEDIEEAVAALCRSARPGAPLVFTALVKSGRLADRYLKRWADAGELFERTEQDLLGVCRSLNIPAECRVTGNLAFLHCRAR